MNTIEGASVRLRASCEKGVRRGGRGDGDRRRDVEDARIWKIVDAVVPIFSLYSPSR